MSYLIIAVTLGTILGVMLGGIAAGAYYFKRIPALGATALYHAYVINTAFFLLMAIARSFETPTWPSWIGIWLLYSLFMLFCYIGKRFGFPTLRGLKNEVRKIRGNR